MAHSTVLRGADVIIKVAGKPFKGAQSVAYTIDYGEQEIYGIDSQFPQEIAPTKVAVSGTISGVRVKLSGGLQGHDLRSKINQILYGSYVSLEIRDRHSDIVLLWVPQMKVSNEQLQVTAKGVARLTFNFKGIIPYNPLDVD